jgi:hypothetical protein
VDNRKLSEEVGFFGNDFDVDFGSTSDLSKPKKSVVKPSEPVDKKIVTDYKEDPDHFGFREMNRAMRILVGDVWGIASDSPDGWTNKYDMLSAKSWGGPVPVGMQNIINTNSS